MGNCEFKWPVGSVVQVSKIGSYDDELGMPEGLIGEVTGFHWPDTEPYQQAFVIFENGHTKLVYDDQVELVDGAGAKYPVNDLGPAATATLNEAIKTKVEIPADEISPAHYRYPNGAEVIDITRHMDFLTGNAVKYLTRAGRKGDRLTDLQKALKYVQWAIEDEENA